MAQQADTKKQTTRKTIVILMAIAIGISAVVGGWVLLRPKAQANDGVLAPDFSLIDVEGNRFQLSDFRGKVVVLDFMAIGCSLCRAEIPHLGTIWEKEEYMNNLILMSIDINPAESQETLRSFAQDIKYATWIWAKDTANLVQLYGVYGATLPRLVIIDTDGYVRFIHDGLTDASVLIAEIDKLLM